MAFKKGNKIGHRFKKGDVGNPNGKPKGSKDFVTQLKEGLKWYAKTYNETFIENYLKRTRESEMMASTIIKKILPDIQEISGKDGQELIKVIFEYAGKKNDSKS